VESFRAGGRQRNRPLNSEPPDLGELNHSFGDPPLYTPLSGAVGDWAIGFAAKTQAFGQARWVFASIQPAVHTHRSTRIATSGISARM